jgi:hypothetical protein
MKRYLSLSALALSALAVLTSGCASDASRMHRAASRDEARRAEFEHCRANGGSNCDAILNEPVNSNTYRSDTYRGDAVREQEAREAYDRCVQRGGSDCDDIRHH